MIYEKYGKNETRSWDNNWNPLNENENVQHAPQQLLVTAVYNQNKINI